LSFKVIFALVIPVRKTKRDVQSTDVQYVTENSVIHIDSAAGSIWMTDFSGRSMWMTEFSVALMFWSCVTPGFFTSVMYNVLKVLM
jgi:hypothetical protein